MPLFRILLPVLCLSTWCCAQEPTEFDVASVRPTTFPSDAYAAGFRAAVAANPCAGGKLEISGTRVTLAGVGICDLIRIAYDFKSYQVIGIPAALGFSGQDKSDPIPASVAIAQSAKQPIFFYDVEARAPGSGPPTQDQARAMLRALLADRFRLTLHQEKRNLAYYALAPTAAAPKLMPAADGCKSHWNVGSIAACGQTMEQLARTLSSRADRVVLDETGLSGKFDYEIPLDPNPSRDFGALAAAVQGHLKLKLEPRKGPITVLVVDHVERPSEN